MSGQVLRISLVVLALASVHGRATAQESPGTFQLGLDGALFSVESETQTAEVAGSGDAETDVSHSRFGLLAPRLGLRMGFLAGNLILIGARVGFSSEGFDTEEGLESSLFRWRVAPTLEVLLPAAGPVRPVVGAYVGAEGLESEVLDASGTQLSAQSGTSLIYGGHLGLHLFASDRVSFDLGIGIGGTTGAHDLSTGAGKTSAEVTTFEVVGLLGINAWLGGSSDAGLGTAQASEMPEPSRPARARGEVHSRLLASGDAVVDVWTDLAGEPGSASIRIARVGERPLFGGCDGIDLLVDGDVIRVPVQHDSETVGAFVEEGLHGRTDLATLHRLAGATSPQIVVCGLLLDLGAAPLLLLEGFLEEAEAQQPPPFVEPEPGGGADWVPQTDPETAP